MTLHRAILWLIVFALLGTGIHWLRGHIKLVLNETESLPHHLFLVTVGSSPERNDFIMFDPPDFLKSHYPFIKQIAGVSGDEITIRNGQVFVDGTEIGTAKQVTRKGHPLHTIAPGIIPPGFYFVTASHKDSYDSRYKSMGLVPADRIIGRAYPLF